MKPPFLLSIFCCLLLFTSCIPSYHTTVGKYSKVDKYEANGFSQESDHCTLTVYNTTEHEQLFTVDDITYKVPAAEKKLLWKKAGKTEIPLTIGWHDVADNVFDEAKLEVIPAMAYTHTYYGDASPQMAESWQWEDYFNARDQLDIKEEKDEEDPSGDWYEQQSAADLKPIKLRLCPEDQLTNSLTH